MRATIERVTVKTETVDIPEKCPKCGCNFTKKGRLIAYDYRTEYEPVTLTKDGIVQPDSPEDERGDDSIGPTDFGCSQCSWTFTTWESEQEKE